jgi:hypothetical protein
MMPAGLAVTAATACSTRMRLWHWQILKVRLSLLSPLDINLIYQLITHNC